MGVLVVKIRNGFVSNSSSSSFVVAFAKKPQDADALQQMMFGKETSFRHPYDDEAYPVSQIAGTVFDDLQKGKELTYDEVATELSSGYIDGEPEDRDADNIDDDDELETRWARLRAKRDDWAAKKAIEFIHANKGSTFYVFSYSDNSGSYETALEHGDVFERLPHIRISHH